MLNYSLLCSCSKNLSSFWLLKQQWTIEEISIFSNSSHLEWRVELSDTILKGTHQGTIPARLGLIWFSGFRGEDLNVKFYDVRRTDGQTDGRWMPSDGKSSYGLWPGEVKTIEIPRCKMHIHFIISYVVQQNVVVNKWLRPKYWPFCRSTGNTSIFSTRFSSSYSADAATGSTSSFRRSYSSVENVGNTLGNINIEDIMYVYFL